MLLDDYRIPTAQVTYWRPIDYKLPNDRTYKSTFVDVPPRKKIICYCGSLRVALDAFKKYEYQSVLDGNIALLPCCRFIMTERKQLKKKLAKLKHYKANLPRLIDCSNVYGDDYYSKDDLLNVDKQIEEVEKQIAKIDKLSENCS